MNKYALSLLCFSFAVLSITAQAQLRTVADSLIQTHYCDYVSPPIWDNLSVMRREGGIVYFTEEGKRLNDVPFEEGDKFIGNRAIVKQKGKWGVINTKMQWVIEPIYDDILLRLNQFFIVKKCNKEGVFNIKGKEIIPTIHDNIEYVGLGLPHSAVLKLIAKFQQGILGNELYYAFIAS